MSSREQSRVAARFAEARMPREPADAYEALVCVRRKLVVSVPWPIAQRKRCLAKVRCRRARSSSASSLGIKRIFKVVPSLGRQACCCARRYATRASQRPSATSRMRSSISSSSLAENDASIRRPGAREIDHCRWWLDRELALVQSPLVVTFGASALRAVAGPSARLADMRGRPVVLGARTLLPTIHPAYLLRLPDPTAKDAETRAFANDLKHAAFLAQRGLEENDNRRRPLSGQLLSCSGR